MKVVRSFPVEACICWRRAESFDSQAPAIMNLTQLKAVETGSEGDGEGKASTSNAIRQEVTFNRLSNWYLSSPSMGF